MTLSGAVLMAGRAGRTSAGTSSIEGSQAPSLPGVYVLLLSVASECGVTVRSGRQFALGSGLYAYVGSARGPGGLAARLARHCRTQKPRHWHVDYLAAVATAAGALCFAASLSECDLARLVAALPGCSAVPGFGCSDCRCPTHLFALPPLLAAGTPAQALRRLAEQLGPGLPLLALVCPEPEQA